ncbi:MAG: hypothetical protein IJJ33_20665 [Victivallales bacterium]|nr:hypothetical protein [Victivallales bacterium]
MNAIVKALKRIQDLEIINKENKILSVLGLPRRTKQLAAEESQLLARIPPSYLERFQKLRETGPAVCTLRNALCMNCRMTLTQGVLERIKAGVATPVCPNCGHFLLEDTSRPQKTKS